MWSGNVLLAQLRAEREARRPLPAQESAPKMAKAEPVMADKKVVIELLSDDDEAADSASIVSSLTKQLAADEALARQLAADDEQQAMRMAGGSSPIGSQRSGNPGGNLAVRLEQRGGANPLGLDLSRVEILRRGEPTPIVLFRAVGGKLGELAQALADFDISKVNRSNRKCGAAENTGTHGKNCDNTFHPLADTNTMFDDKCRRITPEQSGQWVRSVVQPCMAAAAAALGSGVAAARPLLEAAEVAPHVSAEIRVLQYDAPVRTEKKEGNQFHRHLDHGMYGWVVLCSLHAECDFYVRLGPRPAAPTCQCGLPCKLARVTKEGPNHGRYYHACRGQYNACKMWQWTRPGDETPSAERVLRLGHGDVLLFDASRQSDVEHGVDAVYRSADPRRPYRVSIQWRVNHAEVGARLSLAWMAKNLADFDDADVCRLAPAPPVPSLLDSSSPLPPRPSRSAPRSGLPRPHASRSSPRWPPSNCLRGRMWGARLVSR